MLLGSFQQQSWFSTAVVDVALHDVLGCGLWLTSDAFNNSRPNADGRTHSLPSPNAAGSPTPKEEMTHCQCHTNRPGMTNLPLMIQPFSGICIFLFKEKFLFVYFWLCWVFVAAQACSRCSEWRLLFIAGHRLLTGVTSLIVKRGLWGVLASGTVAPGF